MAVDKEVLSMLWLEDRPNEIIEHISMFEAIGFHVLIARTMAEALHEATIQDFDVVITDLLMPPPDGIEFLRSIQPLRPQALLVVYSAYPYNNVYRERIRALPFKVAVIQKTESVRDLVFRILEALAPDAAKLSRSKRSLWARVVDSVELKPGIFGFAVDLKKLAE